MNNSWRDRITVSNNYKKKEIPSVFFLLVSLFYFPNLLLAQTDSISVYDMDLFQLSKIKIHSATKADQNISEVPSTISIITSREIKENGYASLEEALSALPGFQFRDIQGINSYVFQRGIPNQNNLSLLLIDGVQINELNSGGFYAGGLYNLSNVERIEIIYGPASVAYGTNAVTGIINIVTKNAVDNQLKVSLKTGSFNTYGGYLSCSYHDEKNNIGVLFSGMFLTTKKLDLKEEAGDYNWSDKMDNFENDYSFDLKIKYDDFTFGTNYILRQASTATLFKSTGTTYEDNGTSWNIRFINNYLKYDKNISDDVKISSLLYNRNATVLDNTIYYVVDTAQIGYYRPNNLTGWENVINYQLNSFFSFTGGLTFEYESLAKNYSVSISNSPDQKPPVPDSPEMLNNYLASVFIEPQIIPFENFYVSGGIRYDHSSIYDQVLTPRVGVNYNYDNYLFHFSYAEAFRAPKPWDYTDGIGNKSLLPEKMKSLEASATLIFQNSFKFILTWYSNKLEQALIRETSSGGYRWINSGNINTDGIEASLSYNTKNVNSFINYTFNQSYNESHELIPEISKHTANAGLTYSLNEHFSINLRANYLGKRENPKLITSTNKQHVDPALILHGNISLINLNGFDFQLSVKNILDAEYYHTSNRDPDRYRQPQRTIMISAGYTIDY